jgi:hypothetical protein
VNHHVLSWIDTALALEEENRDLRSTIESLLWWVAENRDLCEFAVEQIEACWPERADEWHA